MSALDPARRRLAARLFVSFREPLEFRQSCASCPAYRHMQLEAHHIQNAQNGSEIWMLRSALKTVGR